jgi:hypothetical protein
MDVIERAHPGIVELASSGSRPGFVVRLAERPFPKKLESELRQAVIETLGAGRSLPASPVPLPGFFTRIVRAIKKLFNA